MDPTRRLRLLPPGARADLLRVLTSPSNVRADVHTNSVEGVWSLFKRSLAGSYHQLSAKHLPAYLDEFAFRFNNRENPFLFRDTLRKLLSADALRYAELVAD